MDHLTGDDYMGHVSVFIDNVLEDYEVAPDLNLQQASHGAPFPRPHAAKPSVLRVTSEWICLSVRAGTGAQHAAFA
jgi:hypothetical protein